MAANTKALTLDIGLTRDKDESLKSIRSRLLKEQREIQMRKFLKNKMAVAGFIIIAVMLTLAIFAPVIAKCDPLALDMKSRLKGPSAAHWFGTDSMGRDLFARVLYGARISMFVGFSVGLTSGIAGMVIGLYACTNRYLDNILMRVCDGLKAIPSTLLAITLMTVLGADTKNVIIALIIVSTPGMARLARGSALVAREQTYVEAMRCLGASKTRILWSHIAPNILSPVIVQMTFVFASSIITEAALSFLGAGVPAPAPSWGNILNEGKNVIYNAWWMIVFPGAFTALSGLGLTLLGDGIRDVLDPLSK